MEELWERYRAVIIDYAGRVVGAIALLVVGWLAFKFLIRPIRRLIERSRFGPVISSYLSGLAQSVFIVVLILAVLSQLGVQTASLITLVGAAGLALALSLQNVLANFTSGLLLISYRMFRVGDLIEVGDLRGRVSEMLPFHVILITPDNQRITVPNALLTSGAVRNNSALPQRRVQWTLTLKPQDDLAAVKEALRACLVTQPGVLAEPAPQLYVQDWSDDKRVLAVAAWTMPENYQSVQQLALEELGKCLDKHRQSVERHDAAT